MLSLIYVSTVAPSFDPSELDELVEKAKANNKKREITGMLAYNGLNFMQLLEGKESRVDALMDKIAGDSRHSNLVVVRRENERGRECPDWSMRAFTTPLAGSGSAQRVFEDLPHRFQSDTKILFTSFASLLKQSA